MAISKKICIIGSGLVGSLLAILLAEAGFEIDVYEKRKDPREENGVRGRSIALSLSDRGWKALRAVGLDDVVRPNTNVAYGRIVHQKDGATYSQDYGDGSQAVSTIDRNYLNRTLIEKAAATGHVTFFFEHPYEGFNEMSKCYDYIVGVDGIFSAVRNELSEKGVCGFESTTLDFGYKELRIPPNVKGERVLADHRVQIWPRKNSLLIAFPTNENDFAATFFLPCSGEDSLESINTPALLKSFFEREYSDVLPYLPDLEQEFFQNPASVITQVKGGPWSYENKVLLIGDAVHATSPFYGMGMNVGFEDCTVFMELLREHNNDIGKVFGLLEQVRKPDADAMVDLSYENFKSIGESPESTYQSKWLLERRIWKLLPAVWIPIYVRIAFSDTPIRDIPAAKERQNKTLDQIVVKYPEVMKITDEELTALVLSYMQA